MNKEQLGSNSFKSQISAQPENLHQDLITTINLVYSPINFKHTSILKEVESEKYGAYAFQLNGKFIRFRVAKTTPTKVGQFVTLWKRNGDGPIQPYDMNDQVDFFVICTRKDNQFGQFVFPKSVLHQHDIVSINNDGGKRAIRVYPTWEKTLNRQAQKTQNWQMKYFLDISNEHSIDLTRVQQLYS